MFYLTMENKIIVLTTTYNCEKFIEKSLYSIMSQRFKNFTCYITDDLSTDNTVNIIKKIIKDDDRFKLIINNKKKYQTGNYDSVIRTNDEIKDEDICVEVDGDDWLPDSKVFERVNLVYENPDIWIANGSFKYQDVREGFAKPITNIENLRKDVFTLSHLRTWRAHLWRKIKQSDLFDTDGNYYTMAGDLSFMFPMIEMSGLERYRFMTETNYIYNESNPLNEHKVGINKIKLISNKIRNKTPYNKI